MGAAARMLALSARSTHMGSMAISRSRIEPIDLARGIALLAMAVYHFAWDLEFFGYADPGMTAVGGWKIFARCIASTFLALVGISLFLSHGNGIRWTGFWRRLGMIVAAAAAITVATYIATPDFFIFFGILHQIAFASVAGLLFLRFPAWANILVAAAVIALPNVYTTPLLDGWWGWWTGLSEIRPRSSDFVPVFPYFGAVVAGIAMAQIASRAGTLDRLAAIHPGRWSRPLLFAGRHSLAVYLIHQPVLIAGLWLYAQVAPAQIDQPARFVSTCERTCQADRDDAFCTAYCGCMLGRIADEGRLEEAFSTAPSEAFRATVREMAAACSAETDAAVPGGDQ